MPSNPALAGWLSPQQQRLLLAIFGSADAAVSAYRAWGRCNNWDEHLDPGSFRLLPALYKTLETHRIEDPATGRLKGLYRRSWYRNQHFMNDCSEICERLRSHGVDALLLGGAALAAGYYEHSGSRYVDALDLLVRPRDVAAAVALLCEGDRRFLPPGAS
ncbi:MAG: nucleotidyltransferase family protein, partial [Gemmatimonadetes bacterium]|nr:nucleotidyltransferase family protein [Gemmatimonadota bacterium]